MVSPPVLHERLIRLLAEEEDPAIRDFLTDAIVMAQDPRVSADGLVTKLQRKLPDRWDDNED